MAVLVLSKRAESDLRGLDRETARRVFDAVERFVASGHGDIRKLKGTTNEFRLRVGDWRIRLERRPEGGYNVLRVLNRRDAYRD